MTHETSLVVQWLIRLHTPTAGGPASLVRELDPTRCNLDLVQLNKSDH